MQLIFSEFPAEYEKYHFPYQVYGLREEGDTLDSLYSNGFLPTRLDERLYYLSRSLRVDLSLYQANSENRRVLRKNEDLQMKLISLKEFKYIYTIGKMGKDFYDTKFGPKTMSAQKIKWLFTSEAMTDVMEYKIGNKVIGYTLCNIGEKSLHYAYPFYDIQKDRSNLGMGMMLKAIQYAKKGNMKYIYLGTVYTEKSLYKTQFVGVEYYTGLGWSDNLEQLKDQVKSDHHTHLFNLIDDKKEFLDTITNRNNERY